VISATRMTHLIPWQPRLACVFAGGAVSLLLAGCSPMLAGQMAEAGYHAAKTTLGGEPAGPSAASMAGADARQKKLQEVLNSISVGQEINPILERMGEPPKQKAGNSYGFVCYEYPAVYSATDAAVIVTQGDKVVFYGNSRCATEMADPNFKKDGKYAGLAAPKP
jgi:hypothetical protein